MRNRFRKVNHIFYFIGRLVEVFSLVIFLPLIVVFIYWGKNGDGSETLIAFLVPSLLSFLIGVLLRNIFKPTQLDASGSMIICALGWIIFSGLGAIPFVIGIDAGYLDSYFEAMSGFTTTGITVFSGLDRMPRSILFWRSLTQWLGGIGILSFFLAITFRGSGAHYIFGAESHKISSGRPVPGLFNTLKILWGIYGLFVFLCAVLLAIEGMPIFDSICHALTALSTGGFSPHDASIDYYRAAGYAHFRAIEYTLTFFMMLGGMNFIIHYRVLKRDLSALWDNLEIKYWWRIIGFVTALVMIDVIVGSTGKLNAPDIESTFRYSIFQVISILTTTGFGTRDINDPYFPALSKQIFLVLMVIGGCVGSTGGGIKVLRVVILNRLMAREIRKLRLPKSAISNLVIDRKTVPDEESHRAAALFFTWMGLLVVGGGITAFFSGLSPWASFSGMFSALGNIGPCYISVPEMIAIHPVVKLTYIFGMLAGRLEILPVFLLFSRKAWR